MKQHFISKMIIINEYVEICSRIAKAKQTLLIFVERQRVPSHLSDANIFNETPAVQTIQASYKTPLYGESSVLSSDINNVPL